jgi:hypothetical protein
MEWMSEIAKKMPRGMGAALAGIAAIWGVRSPPEPEVIAQMQPQDRTGGAGGSGRGSGEVGSPSPPTRTGRVRPRTRGGSPPAAGG